MRRIPHRTVRRLRSILPELCNALFAIHPPHQTQLVNYNPERHKKEVGLEFLDHPLIPVGPPREAWASLVG